MGDIVVFPEQFSFDVRVQRSNPRRRLTIKNMGIMACKVTITMPETDSFIVTDAKGKTVGGKLTINMIPDSSCCFFVQKKANVGIVPEDKMMVTGGKKPYSVVLKPAVSLVSIEELESAADASVASDNLSVKSNESVRRNQGKARQLVNEFPDERMSSQDESEPKHRPSRLKPPTKRISKAQSEEKVGKTNGNGIVAPFDPMKKIKKGADSKQSVNNDIEFSASDFQIPQLAEDDDDLYVAQQPVTKRVNGKQSNIPTATVAPKSTPKRPFDKDKKTTSATSKNKDAYDDDSDSDDVPMPTKLDQSPPVARKASQIPVPHRHPDLPPDADVLEQSLHVKFSFKDDDFAKSPQKVPSVVKWYDDDAFKNVEEPDFSFELMMTGEGEDPVFCIDGEYFDSSGRSLSVNQGKGKVVFVTEDGYEMHELGDDNYNINDDDDDM